MILQPFESETPRHPGIAAAMIIVGNHPQAVPTCGHFDLDTKVTLMHDVSEVINETMDTKSTLVIRNFPDELKRRIKVRAYERGESLGKFMGDLVWNGLGALELARDLGLPERAGDGKAEDHRAKELPGAKGVPGPKRRGGRVERVSASREPCKHGAYPGLCKHEECNR